MLVVLATALSGCLGCAVHRPASQEFYKLVDIDSQYFLLPPDRSAVEANRTMRIPVAMHGLSHLPDKDCSIHQHWFSLYPVQAQGAAYWYAETPSASTWEQSGGSVDMKVEWSQFLEELTALAQKQCFASMNEVSAIRQTMIESMATPADDSLFYRYSYGPGGYVDLIPGMELRIERNLFAVGAGGQQNKDNYRGTITTYYDVSQDSNNGSRLKFLRSEGDYKKFSTSVANFPDTTLTAKYEASLHLRLLLQSLAVTANIKSPAILLGSQDADSLNEATRTFVSHPEMSCAELRALQVTCTDFDGIVTVSPMLQVMVNHRSTYVPLGSRVWFVFPHSPHFSMPDVFKTLRIRRLYQGKYIDVQFARNEQDIGQIFLFEGDEISWSGPAKHN
jgi:hypothetical protein